MTSGVCITLVGIINTTYMESSSARVIGPLAAGISLIIAFGLWEQFSKVKYKLCPPEIFKVNNGRAFTAPFFLAMIVTM